MVRIIVESFTSCFVAPESVGGLQWLVRTRQFGHDTTTRPKDKFPDTPASCNSSGNFTRNFPGAFQYLKDSMSGTIVVTPDYNVLCDCCAPSLPSSNERIRSKDYSPRLTHNS